MELPVVNHKDYFAKIGDDHKFPINKFGDLANYLIKEKIVKKLPVSLAAHTSLLKPVADELSNVLSKLSFNYNDFDIVHNYDLSVSQDGEHLNRVLSNQVCSPVRWIETLEKFKSNNISNIIEVGPGSVLSGLIKRFDKSINVYPTKSIEDIKMLSQAL